MIRLVTYIREEDNRLLAFCEPETLEDYPVTKLEDLLANAIANAIGDAIRDTGVEIGVNQFSAEGESARKMIEIERKKEEGENEEEGKSCS